jgi:hypothetical protein
MTDHVGFVYHSSFWSPHFYGLSDDEGGHVFGDVAGGVGFYEEVEVAGLVVAGDGGVGADDLLVGAVGLGERGCDGDMLTDGEAEDCGGGGELEAIAGEVSKLFLGWGEGTDMATLWEMMVFSLSSKSWNSAGLSTFWTPRDIVSCKFRGILYLSATASGYLLLLQSL